MERNTQITGGEVTGRAETHSDAELNTCPNHDCGQRLERTMAPGEPWRAPSALPKPLVVRR
jgi:hypothetical protein